MEGDRCVSISAEEAYATIEAACSSVDRAEREGDKDRDMVNTMWKNIK